MDLNQRSQNFLVWDEGGRRSERYADKKTKQYITQVKLCGKLFLTASPCQYSVFQKFLPPSRYIIIYHQNQGNLDLETTAAHFIMQVGIFPHRYSDGSVFHFGQSAHLSKFFHGFKPEEPKLFVLGLRREEITTLC